MSAPRPQAGDEVLILTREENTDKQISAWRELLFVDELLDVGVIDDPTTSRHLVIILSDLERLSPRKWRVTP